MLKKFVAQANANKPIAAITHPMGVAKLPITAPIFASTKPTPDAMVAMPRKLALNNPIAVMMLTKPPTKNKIQLYNVLSVGLSRSMLSAVSFKNLVSGFNPSAIKSPAGFKILPKLCHRKSI